MLLPIGALHSGHVGTTSNAKLSLIHPLQPSASHDQTVVVSTTRSSNSLFLEYTGTASIPEIDNLIIKKNRPSLLDQGSSCRLSLSLTVSLRSQLAVRGCLGLR